MIDNRTHAAMFAEHMVRSKGPLTTQSLFVIFENHGNIHLTKDEFEAALKADDALQCNEGLWSTPQLNEE